MQPLVKKCTRGEASVTPHHCLVNAGRSQNMCHKLSNSSQCQGLSPGPEHVAQDYDHALPVSPLREQPLNKLQVQPQFLSHNPNGITQLGAKCFSQSMS